MFIEFEMDNKQVEMLNEIVSDKINELMTKCEEHRDKFGYENQVYLDELKTVVILRNSIKTYIIHNN